MRRLFLLVMTLCAGAYALPIDRGVVEDGTDNFVDAGGMNVAGVVLVSGQNTARLRPATCSGSVCTRAFPDAGAEGLHMEDISSCRLTTCGPYDQTLTGTGKEELITRDPVTGQWAHMPAKDLSITVSGERCQAWPVELNGMQAAGVRLLYRPNGVGVSGNDGGSVVTSLQCCKRGSVPLGSVGAPGCGP